MRLVQIAAATLLFIGSAAAGIAIWQIVELTAAEAELSGPAPVLMGDAPPPVAMARPAATPTATPAVSAFLPGTTVLSTASAAATEATTASPRNLSPAVQTRPDITRHPPSPTPTIPVDGVARGASRETHAQTSAPVALRIPRIAISAQVVPVGLNERGEMASPESFEDVGWWQHGANPGDFGRAVLAGHIDSPDGEAIFYRLDQLVPGDEIFIASEDGNGEELRFIVSGAALYHIDHAPVDHIFGPSTDRELILITCGGTFDHDEGSYLYRRVVFAKLAD